MSTLNNKAVVKLKTGARYEVDVRSHIYETSGALAVWLDDPKDGEHFATISTNLPESDGLPSDCFYGKHWSENEGILEQLVAQGIIEPERHIQAANSGFITGINAYRLKGKKV